MESSHLMRAKARLSLLSLCDLEETLIKKKSCIISVFDSRSLALDFLAIKFLNMRIRYGDQKDLQLGGHSPAQLTPGLWA